MTRSKFSRTAWLVVAICALLLAPAAMAAKKGKKAAEEKEGSLPQDKIMKVVEKNKAGIKACYESAKLRKPDIEGSITLRWKVFPEGNVESCEVAESTMDDKDIGECIAGEIKNWTFPKPKGGVVTVKFPFNFKNTDKDKAKDEPKAEPKTEGGDSQPQSKPEGGTDLFGIGGDKSGDSDKAAPEKKSKKSKKAKKEE